MKNIITTATMCLLSLATFAQQKVINNKVATKKTAVKKSVKKVVPSKQSENEKVEIGQYSEYSVPPPPPQIVDLTGKSIPPPTWNSYLSKALQPIVDTASLHNCPPNRYRILIKFVVNEKGVPTNPEIATGGTECNFGQATKEVLLKGPKWPISYNSAGKPIKSIQETNIVFEISSDE